MAGLIVRGDIDEVRSRTNIAEIIGQYLTLKPAGIGSMKGLCPFHEERSPSFHVRTQAGFYHCFGCGEGGDVFTFLQKMDHMSFTDAVEQLAGRIGYTLHYEDGSTDVGGDHSKRARLLEANAAAAEFFSESLNGAEAAAARELLVGRNFDRLAAEQFSLGYAPKGWSNLVKRLTAKGFTTEELLAAGLVSQGDRGVYDRFRGRLIWPIHDVTGQTIGFGARLLYPDDKGPKYLNTPETVLYHKSQVLYGLDLAKRAIAQKRQVVVVEGYTDVMACHLAGVDTAVATCGTAFGPDHIAILRRILSDDETQPSEVIFTFDPDAAGQKAAMRAFTDESRFVAQTSVAIAPEGLDPCDLRIKRGDQAVRNMIAHKQPLVEFAIKQVVARFDLTSVEGRIAGLRATAPMIGEIKDAALRPGYIRLLAGWLGLETDEVEQAVRASGRLAPTHPTSGRRAPEPPADRVPDEAPAAPLVLPHDPTTRLEQQVIEVVLQCPELLTQPSWSGLSRVTLTNESLRAIFATALSIDDYRDEPSRAEKVAEALPQPFAPLVRQLAVTPLPVADASDLGVYANSLVASLLDLDAKKRKAQLLGELGRTDPAADPETYSRIQRELVAIDDERQALQQ